MSQAKEGDNVKIHLTGSTKAGVEFTSTTEAEPIEFQIGSGEVWPSVESAIIGMIPGDVKSVVLPSQEAIPYIDELVFEVDKSQLPEDLPLKEGTMIKVLQQDGQETYVKIVEVLEDKVKLDANHPFAGEELSFKIQLVEIKG